MIDLTVMLPEHHLLQCGQLGAEDELELLGLGAVGLGLLPGPLQFQPVGLVEGSVLAGGVPEAVHLGQQQHVLLLEVEVLTV